MRSLLRAALVLLFVGSGVLHLVRPRPYVRIVPPVLPAPELLVALSGVAEVVGGVALLEPTLRRAAARGLVALLVAVFPANAYMALDPDRAGLGVPPWLLWARLPLQVVLVGAVLTAARDAAPTSAHVRGPERR